MKTIYSFVLITLCLLTGCHGSRLVHKDTYHLDHGTTSLTISTESESKADSVTTKPAIFEMPEVIFDPIIIDANNDGIKETVYKITVGPHSSSGRWITQSEAALSLLKIPMIVGGIIMGIGVILIFYLPVKRIGISVAAAGAGLMVTSYFLANYILYIFIIFVIAIIGITAFAIYDYRRKDRAARVFINDIQELKTNDHTFNHPKDVQKLVHQVKTRKKLGV